MRLNVLTIVFSFFVTTAFAQWGDNYIKLSSTITTETKAISGFDKIEISEDFVVYIMFSDSEEKVEIEANENLHELIQVSKEGSTLKIDTKSYSTSSGGIGRKNGAEERLVAHITAKRLKEIKADEDVVIELKDKFIGDKLSIILNEDCTLQGHLEVQDLKVLLEEDCEIAIEGSAQAMDVEANEDCMIKGSDFVVGNLKIQLDEDSEAKLTVNGEVDLVAKDDSYFHYRGDANFVRKRLRGDSEVKTW